jgi:ribosomal protein S1
LRTNTVYSGIVTGTTEKGIYVEFMGFLTGMIHVSNVDPEWQNRLHEIPAGYEIEFYVENITSSNKINLTQILRETLWDTIKINQVINAQVKSIKSQGILCKLGDNNNDNIMGMIHTSELEKSNKTFNIGDTLMVKAIKIDREDRKIFLSIA